MTETQHAVLKWMANGATGISSETLAFWVAFDIQKEDGDHPYDPADLSRCLMLLEAAPALRPHLHKMSSVSPEWSRLVANWDEIEKTFIDEAGLDWAKRGSAEKTYNLMKMVIDGQFHRLTRMAKK